MARTQRDTVKYFPHDSDASTGDTLTVLQARFGNDGYAFWFKLLEKLASTEGHALDCTNSNRWQLLLAKAGVNEITGVEIMNLLVEMQAVDKDLWSERVIWCQHLVDNISDVYSNRKRVTPSKPIPSSVKLLTTRDNAITTAGNCIVCGNNLEGMRADAKYCSDQCRLRGFRETDSETDNQSCETAVKRLETVETDNSERSETVSGITRGNNPITTPNNSITTPDNAQSKLNYIKLKQTKEEETRYPPNPPVSGISLSKEDLLEIYKENIGPINKEVEGQLDAAIEQFPGPWIRDAIKEACLQNRRTWRYAAGILLNWERYGRHKEEHGEAKDINKCGSLGKGE